MKDDSHEWHTIASGNPEDQSELWVVEKCKLCGAKREFPADGGGTTIIYHPDGVQLWRVKYAPTCSAIRLDNALR